MDRRQLSVLVVTLTVAIASVNGQCTLDAFPSYDSARKYSEFAAGVQAIVPQYKFPCTGVVRQLTAQVGTGAAEDATGLELQIWRPAGNGSYNLHWGMRHPSFGETSRNGSIVTFSPQIAIPVTRGDVIGFYISTVDSGESSFHLLYDPNVQGVIVYRTSREIDVPFCNFTICADSDIARLSNTAPLISAIYESTTDIQSELDRLSQFRVMDRCVTTNFSTCSVTPTKFVGALQTPSPSPPSPPSPSPPSSPPPSPSSEELPLPGTIRLTSETIVSIVIGVLLFIVLIILVVVLVACVCHKRTAVSLDNKTQLGSVDHLTVTTHLNTPVENGHRGMQAFDSTAIQEPSLDNHHCYWNVNREGECRAPATPMPCSNGNRVMSNPVLENGHVDCVTAPRRHTASGSTTHSIRSTNPPQISRSKVPTPARYQLTHKPLPTPPEEGGPDYTDPDGPPTLKAAHSYDKLDRYDRLGILPELEASYDMADYHEPQSLSEEMDYSASQQYAYVPTEEERQILQLHTNGHYEIHVRKDSMAQGYDKLKFFQETDIYWAPAATTSGLYTQLSEYKYREIPRHQIRILKQIGSGHFGTVSKGAWSFCSGASRDVAVKTVRSTSEVERIKLLQEAAIMGQFAHPNVVRLHGVVTVGDPVLVVLEYMLRGDLRSFLQKIHPNNSKRELPETLPVLFIKFSKDVAAGMSYLAKKSFVHRDLAARNILLTHDLNCKIGDFGMARDIEGESDYYKSHGGIIPVKWTAPEALNYNKYTSASDVWSFGMVLFEIWSVGEKPFSDLSNPIVVALVSSKHCQAPPPGCPKPIYHLMVECWNPVHTLRPTFDSILDYLDSPEDSLLQWRTEDTVPGKQAHVLGAPLLEANNLYFDLQRTYQKPSDGMSRGSNT